MYLPSSSAAVDLMSSFAHRLIDNASYPNPKTSNFFTLVFVFDMLHSTSLQLPSVEVSGGNMYALLDSTRASS